MPKTKLQQYSNLYFFAFVNLSDNPTLLFLNEHLVILILRFNIKNSYLPARNPGYS